jgi:hypothetical protein
MIEKLTGDTSDFFETAVYIKGTYSIASIDN